MRAQMFKIAGVKNEKDFYKKFPNEASFMKKHGKAFKKAQDGLLGKMGGVGGIMGSATNIMGGIQGLMNEKNVVKETEQQKQLTGLNRDVAAMGDEEQERDYVRPEDIQNTGEEFFPIYGVGTNVLQKGGMIPYGQDGLLDPRQEAYNRRKAAEMARSQEVYSTDFKTERDAGMRASHAESIIQMKRDAESNIQSGNKRKALIKADIQRRDDAGLERISDPMVIGNPGDPTNRGTIAGSGTIGSSMMIPRAQYGMMARKGKYSAQFGAQIEDPNQAAVGQQKTFGQKMGNWLGAGQQGEEKDAQGNVTQEAMNSNAGNVAEAATGVAGMLGMEANAGGQLGKGVGEIAGKFIPIPGFDKIAGAAGQLIGNALDPHAKNIKKNQKVIDKNINQMTGMGVGSQVQSRFSGSVQNGGNINAPMYRSGGLNQPSTLKTYEDFAKAQNGDSLPGTMDGELQTHWGGNAEPISYNPFLPDGGETVEFKGDMHNGSNTQGESGIGASYGGSPVEVEGGEPATRLQDGGGGENLAVYGNLTISKDHANLMGIPKAANKKAKNYVKDISKREVKSNKAIKKNMKASEELEPLTSFDKLKQSSYKANIDGNTSQLKNAANEKQDIAQWQNAITSTAEEMGIEANALAKGRIKQDKGAFTPSNQAQDGGSYPMAQHGNYYPEAQDGLKTITEEQIQEYKDKGYVVVDPPSGERKLVKKGKDGKVLDSYMVEGGKSNVSIKGILEDEDLYKTFHSRMKGKSDAEKRAAAERLYYDKIMPGQKIGKTSDDEVYVEQEAINAPTRGPQGLPSPEYTEIDAPLTNAPDAPRDKKGNLVGDIMQGVNATLPYWRPSDKDRFDTNQLSGEMYALSHNALDPVQAQKFTPQLDVPYDISLQDQRNDISSAGNAARRMGGQYNPGVAANIAAGEYEALNKVNAQEFRANQAKKDQVYSGNRKTVDDANLKNLGILDQQYVRQSQAKSNTKEAKQTALNSISSKMKQHKLENKTLGTYENMYNYRFGKDDIAQSFNPLARFNLNGNGQPTEPTPEEIKAQGKIDAAEKLAAGRKDAAKTRTDGSPVINQNGGSARKIALTRALKGY
jgi:hypothetical protein